MRGVDIARLAQLERKAYFSQDQVYRYALTRIWGESPRLNVIMLNPSVADEERDDNTIRRVMEFAHREGFYDVSITNIFALRATSPLDLLRAQDPIGPENDDTIQSQASVASQVWVAWGSWKNQRMINRAFVVTERLVRAGVEHVYCLGLNADGSPAHPLYRPGNTKLVPWTSY